MEILYRCMKCGTHVTPKQGEYPECNICTVETVLVLVTEKNKHTLPRVTDPVGMHEIDFEDPSKNCRCAPGICPCGKFVAHLASEAWDPDNPHLFGSEYEEWNKSKEERS